MSSTIVSIISPYVWDGMVYFANPFTLDTTGLQNFQSQLALGKSLFSCQMTFLDPYPLALSKNESYLPVLKNWMALTVFSALSYRCSHKNPVKKEKRQIYCGKKLCHLLL